MKLARVRSACCLLLLAFVSAACNDEVRRADDPDTDDAIRVASFDFGESQVIAEIYAQALENAGLPVERYLGLGPRETVVPALEQDRVDLVPEYLGTALRFVSLGVGRATSDPASTFFNLQEELTERGLTALRYAPGQDRNEFVVTAETAEEYDLDSLSDLKAHASSLTLGGPPECPSRPLCLQGLEVRYGTHLAGFLPLDAGGPLTLAALESGEIDIAVLFSTDPDLSRPDLVILEDDRELQPAENIVPVTRTEIIGRYGNRYMAVLNAVTEALSTSELRELNRQMESENIPMTAIARGWLQVHETI